MDTSRSFQSVLIRATQHAPTVGKLVSITRGKHKGAIGIVTWHGKDRFSPAGRYESNWLQTALREARGKYGFSIRVRCPDGTAFFASATYAADPDCPICQGTGVTSERKVCYGC